MSFWDRPLYAVVEYARMTLREVLSVYLIIYYIGPEFVIERELLTVFLLAYFFDYAVIWAYVARDRKTAKLEWRVTLSRFLFLSASSWYFGFWYTVYVATVSRTMYGCLKKVGFLNILDFLCVTFTVLVLLILGMCLLGSLKMYLLSHVF